MAGKTILLATDGSPSAHKALETAIELATITGWSLHIVTAWAIPVSGFGYGVVAVGELAESERAAAQEALGAAVERSTRAGLETTTAALREGFPVEEICAAAGECDAALIVIGAHGWGRLKRLFFGSVSSGVLQQARCPVLVVRDVRTENGALAEVDRRSRATPEAIHAGRN